MSMADPQEQLKPVGSQSGMLWACLKQDTILRRSVTLQCEYSHVNLLVKTSFVMTCTCLILGAHVRQIWTDTQICSPHRSVDAAEATAICKAAVQPILGSAASGYD